MESISANSRAYGFMCDVATIPLVFLLVQRVDLALSVNPVSPGDARYYVTFALITISWLLSLSLTEYPSRRNVGPMWEFWIVSRANVLALLIFAVMIFLFKVSDLSRLFILIYFLLMTAVMILNRCVIRIALYAIRSSGWDQRTRIIVGTGEEARKYLDSVELNAHLGIRVLGYVTCNDDVGKIAAPCLGMVTDLPKLITKLSVDGVLIALPLNRPEVEELIQVCETLGVLAELILDGLSSRLSSSRIVHNRGVTRLVLSGIPHSVGALFWKRATDVLISTVLVIILSPLFLALGIAIKLDDGGPILFKQTRVGHRGKLFKMYKFRSMRPDAEVLKRSLEHLNEMTGPVFKVKNDPRVTRVGRLIRKTSLDELPQLFNVLRGNMSLVGPRPPLELEVSNYDWAHTRRLSVRPGITGLWQVSGRNNVNFEDWVKLDLQYIDTWSYSSDIKILLRTIPAVLRRDGAY